MSEPNGPKALRILIAEDDVLIALDVEETLTEAGHEVIGTAVTEDEAVAMAAEMAPDLVIMDLRLARGSSGEAAARRIRETAPVALVFASGNLDPATRARLAEMEPVAFLPKPYLPLEVIKAVAAA